MCQGLASGVGKIQRKKAMMLVLGPLRMQGRLAAVTELRKHISNEAHRTVRSVGSVMSKQPVNTPMFDKLKPGMFNMKVHIMGNNPLSTQKPGASWAFLMPND